MSGTLLSSTTVSHLPILHLLYEPVMKQSLGRGNTEKGVNQTVLDILRSTNDLSQPLVILDIPCGEGGFACHLKEHFPNLRVIGVDRYVEPKIGNIEFHKLAAQEFFAQQSSLRTDVITCISGVVCFDGLETLFASFHRSLRDGGLLILTNDNVMTVRDRLTFLFFGHVRRFRLLYTQHEGNWNLVLPQALWMWLQRSGFRGIRVQYTSIHAKDYLFLPVALVMYAFFLPYLLLKRHPMTIGERLRLFPIATFLCRHYVFVARK